jgi:hypothetical protein
VKAYRYGLSGPGALTGEQKEEIRRIAREADGP